MVESWFFVSVQLVSAEGSSVSDSKSQAPSEPAQDAEGGSAEGVTEKANRSIDSGR